MKLSDTFTLPKSGRYTSPKSDSDLLPYIYGDMTILAEEGSISCSCLDETNFIYGIACHAIRSVADGNTISVYIDGTLQSSGYTVTTSGNLEGQGTISYIDFTADPDGDVTVSCQGKADSSGTLIENPIEILEDWLTTMDIDDLPESSSFAKASDLADSLSLTAAGVIVSDQTGAYWFSQLLGSFLGDWWMNAAGKIVVNLDMMAAGSLNVAGFLDERRYVDLPEATQRAENLCNQPRVSYAPSFATRDRRYSEGSNGNFNGLDDGDTIKDVSSQDKYGVQIKPFELWWVRSVSLVAVIQARIVELFADPLWVLNVIEQSFRNIHCERGDYVVASCHCLRDEQGRELKNQIWRVVELERILDDHAMSFMLQDTGNYWAVPPITYDGTYSIGGYDGRIREIERIA